jgi:hypothetical protein
VRYYAIKVSGASNPTGLTVPNSITNFGTDFAGIGANLIDVAGISNPLGAQWSSIVNGQNDPGALDIEFDITVSAQAISQGSLTIYGVTQGDISQATYLTGGRVQLWAGFTEGLPLANNQVPHQGLIADGQIYPAYGNWTGNELCLSMIIKNGDPAGPGGPTDVKNIIHNLPQGSPLSSAIQNALQNAFPNSQFLMNIKDSLVLNAPDQGFYQGMEQYMNYIKSLSHSIAGTPSTNGYQGVQILPVGYGKYVVTDFSKTGNTINLQYEDLIGQPTWVGENKISVKTVLRADLNAAWSTGNNVSITLPENLLVNLTAGQALMLNPPGSILGSNQYEHGNILLFTGAWQVTSLRHMGHYRQTSGTDWVTVIEANASSNFVNAGAGIAQTGGQQTFSPSPGGATQ